jgi:hypothetical protein
VANKFTSTLDLNRVVLTDGRAGGWADGRAGEKTDMIIALSLCSKNVKIRTKKIDVKG